MSDFDAALQARLTRNAELAEQRQTAEHEMDRVLREREADEQRRQQELVKSQQQRHTDLASRLQTLAERLKAASPDAFIVRMGWTPSREEFIAKITTRTLEPPRSLFIELDRDDDEVLARWHSDVGNSLELWRLLEVDAEMLDELVLQVADQQLWHNADRPPPFPTPRPGAGT